MAELYVEGWSPEYGAAVDLSDERVAASPIDTSVEVDGLWSPMNGHDDDIETVAFVDGIRRIDARLTLDDPVAGPVAGICGSFAVGATIWDRKARRSVYAHQQVHRMAVLASGSHIDFPIVGQALDYRAESVATDDPAALLAHFHGAMRRAEAALSARLAASGTFVIADGPINELRAQPIVGYIKSHRVTYLGSDLMPVIGRVRAGQRTPIFLIDGAQFARYSWYVRLADLAGGHSWTGIVRCEAPTALGIDAAARLADRTAALLPLTASEPHIDPRAPQNLVPIAALERHLRRRLGDQALVYRSLQAAVAESRATLPAAEFATESASEIR
ncbi:MAG: hypothetical protein OEM97_00655 [Acidimicrobiia bacterium]|nr:hypothetical protein [Acidimicrobiia bacterium]